MAKSKGIGRQKAQGQAKQGPRGKNYLFVMGINEYEHVPSLSNAVKDAKDLIAILTSKYQFDPENIVSLFDKKATMPNIYQALNGLIAKVSSQDNLIIYFSGHGYFDKGDKTGHLVPVNARRDAVWEYLSNANLLNRIRAIDSFHTLLIVDSCFSGSLILRKELDSSVLAEKVERFPSRWGLAAGRIEVVEDGIRGDNSPFAKSILSFLKANMAPKFPASELIQHVKRVTPHNGAQTPVGGPLFKVGDVGGEFVFHLRESGAMKWEAAWEKIQIATEKDEWEITHKIRLLHDYVRDFDSADNYEVALELGEKLEHKRDFFQAKGSLFKMRRFARKKTPFQQEAQLLIAEMQKREQAARKEMDAEKEKDRQQQQQAEKQMEAIRQPPKSKLIKPPSIITETDSPIDTFTDPRDGQVYQTVVLNGQTWLAQNLNFEVKDSWHYKDDPKHGKQYGRLYTWEAAKKACPPGWRLPADEEWKSLAKKYGGYYDYSNKEDIGDPKKAYQALIQGGSSGLQAVLGGWRLSNGSYSELGSDGDYWSSTENDVEGAWYYYYYGGELSRSNDGKSIGRSCRCLKN